MLRDERLVAAVVDHELEREALRIVEDERSVVALAADAVLPEVERLLDATRNAMRCTIPRPRVRAASPDTRRT